MATTYEQHRVLVIDAAFQPTSVVTLRRAVTKLFAGRADVVVYSKDGAVIGRGMRRPAVIQLQSIVPRWKQRVRFCRRSVFARDAFTCSYCGLGGVTEELTLDHVLPRSQGGVTTWENVTTACVDCNQRKANRTPDRAGMRLRRRPFKPAYVMQVEVSMETRGVPEEWQGYWSDTLEP